MTTLDKSLNRFRNVQALLDSGRTTGLYDSGEIKRGLKVLNASLAQVEGVREREVRIYTAQTLLPDKPVVKATDAESRAPFDKCAHVVTREKEEVAAEASAINETSPKMVDYNAGKLCSFLIGIIFLPAILVIARHINPQPRADKAGTSCL